MFSKVSFMKKTVKNIIFSYLNLVFRWSLIGAVLFNLKILWNFPKSSSDYSETYGYFKLEISLSAPVSLYNFYPRQFLQKKYFQKVIMKIQLEKDKKSSSFQNQEDMENFRKLT